ncbi:N-acetylglutamate synthase [Achromatium sp. WMS1]|nr:N-acetylglutamate synthase [Achromatium sp. WMS1]
MINKDKYASFVNWFRNTSPYIHAHRGRIFVISFGGEALLDSNFSNLVHDLALLHGLGVRLVLVHDVQPQVEAKLQQQGDALKYVQGLPVVDDATLACVKETVGMVRVELETLFSMGLANSPMAGVRIRIVSGNFVAARPLGIHDGVDCQHAGVVRRIDKIGIRQCLDLGIIVLIPPIGYSPTGEVFKLAACELSSICAIELKADKLIDLVEEPLPKNSRGETFSHLTPQSLMQLLTDTNLPTRLKAHLQAGLNACQNHVSRIHLLQRQVNGVLLQELFTRDGAGILLTAEPYEMPKIAHIDNVSGILQLLCPLEERGVLVRRSRELLETEIKNFTIMERDGTVIACAALYPFVEDDMAELACLAVHDDYRRSGRGALLLAQIEQQACSLGIKRIFVLTTQTAHWFLERGFVATHWQNLPIQRQLLYNYKRNSKVFVKSLHNKQISAG